MGAPRVAGQRARRGGDTIGASRGSDPHRRLTATPRAVCWGVRTEAVTIASRAAIAALAILAAATPGAADPRPVHPYRVRTGQRVRLWTPPEHGGFQSTNATVTAVDSSGLTVVIKDRTELMAFTDLARMDVRRDWRYLRRAAVVGLVVGAAVGALAEDGDGQDKLRSGALYGGVGAAVGAATAGAIWPARWVPVDLDSIRPQAIAHRAAVRVSFTFSF